MTAASNSEARKRHERTREATYETLFGWRWCTVHDRFIYGRRLCERTRATETCHLVPLYIRTGEP